jgi:molybdenum-dependent DNA-binding transcriptional regulator ModE
VAGLEATGGGERGLAFAEYHHQIRNAAVHGPTQARGRGDRGLTSLRLRGLQILQRNRMTEEDLTFAVENLELQDRLLPVDDEAAKVE